MGRKSLQLTDKERKERIKGRQRQYREKNKTQIQERDKIYRESHKKERLENKQVGRENNREELNLKRKMAYVDKCSVKKARIEDLTSVEPINLGDMDKM